MKIRLNKKIFYKNGLKLLLASLMIISSVISLSSCAKKAEDKKEVEKVTETEAEKELTIEETIGEILLNKDVDLDSLEKLSTNFKENYTLNPLNKDYLKEGYVDENGYTISYYYEVVFKSNRADDYEVMLEIYKKITRPDGVTLNLYDKNLKSIYYRYSLNKRNKLETLEYLDEDDYYDENFNFIINGVKFNERNFMYIIANIALGEDYLRNTYKNWENAYFLNYRTTEKYKEKYGIRKSAVNKELIEKIVDEYEKKLLNDENPGLIPGVVVNTATLVESKLPDKKPADFYNERMCPLEITYNNVIYRYYIHFDVADDYYLDDIRVEVAPEDWEFRTEEEEESEVETMPETSETQKVGSHIASADKKKEVSFTIDKKVEDKNEKIVEDEKYKDGIHSLKYYSYISNLDTVKEGNFIYRDVRGNERRMTIDEKFPKNDIVWDNGSVKEKKIPTNNNISYGIDISHHNGDIDFNKVKNAGFDFVIARVVYRGYGQKGTLLNDNLGKDNIIKAKASGLKVGAYVFSQAINKEEAIEEAKLVIDTLDGEELDLPIFYDPETIRNDTARTDDITKEVFTENAIAFMEYIKSNGYKTGFYSNMVWEDYYFDMSKLKNYDVWYADYEDYPQTPYKYKYWQFAETGKVDGVKGYVDLNVMIE